MQNVTQLKTKVQRWAEKINHSYSENVQAIINVGQQLIRAKKECSPGEWGELTGQTTGKPLLPFGFRTAQYLKSIAENSALANAQHAAHLPASWYNLATLASLKPELIEILIKGGLIHPDISRKDTKELVFQNKQREIKKAPIINLEPQEMTAEEQQIWADAKTECTRLLTEYADDKKEAKLAWAEYYKKHPPSDETIESARIVSEVLLNLDNTLKLLKNATSKPRFHQKWLPAIRCADKIIKHLEKLT